MSFYLRWVRSLDGFETVLHVFTDYGAALGWRERVMSRETESGLSPADVLGIEAWIEEREVHP